jgi:general secretion pathway protein G
VRAKENRLREDLFALRTVLDEYAFDRKKSPRTIESLLEEHYLREMPIDPFTGSRTTWRILMENSENAIDKSAPGIFAIKSGSTKIGQNGKRYSDW